MTSPATTEGTRVPPLRSPRATSRYRVRGEHLIDSVANCAIRAVIACSVIFMVVPLLFVLCMSLDARDYLANFPPPALSLRWYGNFFGDPYLMQGLKTSLLLAASASVIATPVGIACAVAIDHLPSHRREFATSLFLSPLIVPGVVIGFALLLFYARFDLQNGFLRLVLAHVLITFSYPIRTVLAALSGIPRSMMEAALSLGATERQAFWTVTVPLMRAGIAAGAIFAFVYSLDDVAVSLFLSDPRNYTLPVALLSMMHANFDLTIAAAAIFLVGLTGLLMVALDRVIGLNTIFGIGLYRT